MREIKFRAWHKSGGVMSTPFDLMGASDAHERIDLDRCEIMQYTGLKDKNGVEIYEGDIITAKLFTPYVERISWRGEPDIIGEVYWGFSAYGLAISNGTDKRYAHFSDIHDINFDHCEVVGNIYENPEILKALDND